MLYLWSKSAPKQSQGVQAEVGRGGKGKVSVLYAVQPKCRLHAKGMERWNFLKFLQGNTYCI